MCVLGNQILVVWLPFFTVCPVFVVSLREGTMWTLWTLWTKKVRLSSRTGALTQIFTMYKIH